VQFAVSTLILLRHGQAMFGADNYDQLTGHGELQARACSEFWQTRKTTFTRALIGPRQRHKDTARIALRGLPAPQVEQEEMLDEFAEASELMAAAELRTGIRLTGVDVCLPKSELLRHYGSQIKIWSRESYCMAGIENITDFRRRVAGWLDALTDSRDSGQRVLAVTSGGVIAVVISEILGLSNAVMADTMWNIENGSLTAVFWSHKGRAIRYFNSTAHLPPELNTHI
jgi:broad specificity phosphatase PhoE